MTEILVAPVASALKLKEENEELKAQLRREREEKEELKAQLRRKEEEDEAEMVEGSHEEEGREVHRIVKSALTESCLNQLRESCSPHLRETNEDILKKIINNPTFTILQDEGGAIPSQSKYGKFPVMKKYKLYPRIRKGCGTGYLRWENQDTTYYLVGSEGKILCAKTNKITEKKKTGHLAHDPAPGMHRVVGKALYYGLEDLIKSA